MSGVISEITEIFKDLVKIVDWFEGEAYKLECRNASIAILVVNKTKNTELRYMSDGGQDYFVHGEFFKTMTNDQMNLHPSEDKPPGALMFVSSAEGSWFGVSGGLRWQTINKTEDGKNGYFYMGFLDRKYYGISIDVSKDKKTAEDGAYEIATSDIPWQVDRNGFTLQATMPTQEEFEAMGGKDSIKAKSVMVYVIRDQDEI